MTLLREFHERMAAQIFACGGTVEKYIGDEIFAVFGLPNAAVRRRRQRAAAAPTACSTALDAWNAERAATRRAAAGDRHRPQLRAGGAGRCRQRAQPLLHRDRRHGQHREPPAGLTRNLKTPLVVADAIVSNIEAAPPADTEILLGALTNQGEQVLQRPQRRGAHLDKAHRV